MTASLLLERLMRVAKQRGGPITLSLDPTEPNPERWMLQAGTRSACGDAADGGDLEQQIASALADFETGALT